MITPNKENTVKVEWVVRQGWLIINSCANWINPLLAHLYRYGMITPASTIAAREHPNPFQSLHSFLVQLTKDEQLDPAIRELFASLLNRGDVHEAAVVDWKDVDATR